MTVIRSVEAIPPRVVLRLALGLLTGFLMLLTACAGGPRPEIPGPAEPDPGLPARLHAQLREAHDEGADRRALQLGYELIDRHPDYAGLDDAILTAADSAVRLGDSGSALRLTREMLVSRPDSPRAADYRWLQVDLYAAAGDTLAGVSALLDLHSAAAAGAEREKVSDRIADLAAGLSADDLETLMAGRPDHVLRPYMSYLRLYRLLREQRAAEAPAAVEALRREAPRSDWLARAEALLAEPGYALAGGPPARPTDGGMDSDAVGLLCPLTGRYMVLGNAFYDGARLALDAANRSGWRQFRLPARDTGGDPVTAAIAARRFAAEEKPVAMVGSLLSAPTVAAALVADGFGIPLISPTATNERIWELGAGVFQTNLTGLYEARLLARTAVHVLLKHRFAVLHPDTPEGVRNQQIFADEVMALGGEIVAVEALGEGLTDFREPLARVRAARPEVIFAPVSVDGMMMLGPQLDFYRCGALVMGPSSWNTPRLEREVGSILERAVFPSDTALFPVEWSEMFAEGWHPEHLPQEATAIAQRSFHATMLVLSVLAEEQITSREDLVSALASRLEARRETEIDIEALGPALHVWSDGGTAPFPMDLFAEVQLVPETEEASGGMDEREASASDDAAAPWNAQDAGD